ncbi:MAG: response regulator [Thaumarchaeota archaeon]|nr:response regulator [Nitrososphaerota archaeon]
MKNEHTAIHKKQNNRFFIAYNILVTEDSSFMRTMLSDIFKSNSSIGEVYEAGNGIEALEIYNNKKPDLVTMDIDMPEMNGFEAAKNIKSSDYRAKIVIVTSSHKKEAMQTAKELGIKVYITKPFDNIKIEKLIENISEL